jgi:hypothetical protein
MNFIVISTDQVGDLARIAKSGNEKAGAVLRALAACRDADCVLCNDEFSRRNEVAAWIVAIASEPSAEFGVRPMCKRCVSDAGGLEGAVSAPIAPTVGTA